MKAKILCLVASFCLTTTAQAKLSDWHFGGGIGYNCGGNFDLFVVTTDGSQSLTSVGASFFYQVEIDYAPRNSLGFNFGYEREPSRALNNGDPVSDNRMWVEGGSRITISDLFINVLYRWENWYVPVGFNITNTKLENPSISYQNLGTFPGFQFGIGRFFSNHFVVESDVRFIGIDTSFESWEGTSSTDSYGFFTEVQFALKAFF